MIFGLAIGAAFLELGLRAVGPAQVSEQFDLHVLRPDRTWLYGMRPGAAGRFHESGDVHYRVNADGFRDREYAQAKPDGVFRIIILGDSVAFGWGVDQADTFTERLEAKLSQQLPEPKIEVLNLGISGYNPYTQARLLEDVGVRYQPDLVIVQFCINDLNDPTLHFGVQTRQHLGAIPDAAYPDPSKRRDPLAKPGWLIRTCRKLELCTRLDEFWLGVRAVEPDDEARRAAAVPVDGKASIEWTWLETHYADMANIATNVGSDFAVLAFPYSGQLGGHDGHPVQRRMMKLAAGRSWLLIDPLPAFEQSGAKQDGLFLDWWHPTPLGHRIASDVMLSSLACSGLLPPAASRLCLSGPDATTRRK